MTASCRSFVNILNSIYAEGIKTRYSLEHNTELYTSFWFAVHDFVNFALLSKTSKKKNGEVVPGNLYKTAVLEERGYLKEDIHADCVVRILEKVDLVLAQPLAKQKNYCFRICNNVVNDQIRKLLPKGIKLISLQDTVKGNWISTENARTYEEVVGDITFSPERIVEEQDDILYEIKHLSKKPAEVLIRLACTHLGMKPRVLAAMLVQDGVSSTVTTVLLEIRKQYNIDLSVLQKAVTEPTAESVKVDSNDEDIVASQVSRLIYRSAKRLE